MDRLRLRFWDKEEHQYLKPSFFDSIWFDKDGGIHVGCYSDIIGKVVDYTNEVDIEQCTGLKDKNGNLIYIGDKIKCGNGLFNTATVEYENGENFIDGIYPFNLYHDCGDECHCQLRDFPEYACEIIGNIHEQAEQKGEQ